jgi:hypothetical protein
MTTDDISYMPIDFCPEPMTMSELAETNCKDCRWCTILLGEFYMVHDHVWEQAQSEPKARFLCIGCLEERLGRMLTPDDFMDVKLNDPNKPQRVSSRLRKRLTGKAAYSTNGPYRACRACLSRPQATSYQ